VATRLHLVAGKATDSVTHGFLPAAAELGLAVTVLTDRPAGHRDSAAEVVECQVTDFRDIIEVVSRRGGPGDAIFSNSDHLQAPTALAAAYFDLPGKDWRAATRTKNKALLRRHLSGLDPVFSAEVTAGGLPDAPYPLVLKPREGVASEDVFLAHDPAELAARYREIRSRRADPLVAEEFLPGRLHTLETLGDGTSVRVLGSFRTTLSPPPYFVEERLDWAPPPPESEQVRTQLAALGVGFGACHTEFVVADGRARIIEVNYRIIGDHCDFLLAELLGVPLFADILRVHLGEPLPAAAPPPHAFAAVESVIADRSGTLRAAPEPGEYRDGAVRLTYRSVRSPGDQITISRTNRDYLGTIQAIGPTSAEVDAALTRFRAEHRWPIEDRIESELATRVVNALVREDYAGIRSFLRLRPHQGFLTDVTVDEDLRLDDVLALVARAADPRDDVATFAQECREALATARLTERARPEVFGRLRWEPGATAYYETLAAYNEHPVYPTGRCRLGLSELDLRRYAPEFAPVFALRWADVPGVTASGERPEWWPGDRIPVHPLTAAEELGVALDPSPYLEVSPTLSMRTVVVDARTHLKLPLPTSTLGRRNRRELKPGTLSDGALMERILRRVLAREDLPVLLADEQTYGHADNPLLGYLVRRFPPETEGAHVVPVAALLARAPNGRYVIEQWNVAQLFGDYLTALFRWNVTLFRYGIALEAHQQNVSLVLREGAPLRLLVKDNDGALLDVETLAARLGPGPYEFSDPRMATRDPEALARVFVTITLHLCAGALAFGLAERGLLPLREGLALVRDRLAASLGSGPADRLLHARTLAAPRLATKAMVTAGTLVDKARTGALDINKHYGPDGPNYLDYFRDDTCS
jgi:biotin carboxylase